MAIEFTTGQHLLAAPDLKRYVLVNNINETYHLVTEKMLRDAFLDECDKIMSGRNISWSVYEYFE
jgi:hypothetical protein